jgi:RimJ/RimL family protein N-acetyltransferase
VYVGIQDKHKIGVCRFNQDPLSLIFEVSINLNSDFRGKGYSRLLLGESINLLFHEKNAMLTLNATIRIDNLESIKLFQNFGFQLKKTFDDYAIYSYVK